MSNRSLPVALAIALTVVCCVPAGPQVAAPPSPASPTGDPPGRVGRLAYIGGTVSFRAAGDTAWAAAVPNSPVTTGDALWADNAGRVEVEIGSAYLAQSKEIGADLLIKGAYSHSRLRQMILGGRTRHILTNTEIPVFLSH